MRRFIPILFLFCLFTSLTARAQWSTRTSKTSQILRSVSFSSPMNGWAAGDGGVILFTTNGGDTWNPAALPDLPSIPTLHAIYTYDQGFVWTGGESNMIFALQEGTYTFVSYSQPSIGTVRYLQFNSETKGWALGSWSMLLQTTDGGVTWVKRDMQEIDARGGYFFDDSSWMAVGPSGSIVSTDDASTTWETIPSGTTSDLYAMEFAENGIGWVVGDTTILKTTDYGYTWSKQTLPVPAQLRAIAVLSEQEAYAAGRGGVILHTTDGSTWKEETSGTASDLLGIDFTEPNFGWAVGTDGTIVTTVKLGTVKSVHASAPAPPFAISNSPNPFTNSTRITIDLAESGTLRAVVRNVIGQLVAEILPQRFYSSGQHTIIWNATSLNSGYYSVEVTTERGVVRHRMMLVR